jgi:succinate dehydrogenase / fumarate reductase membrane anchor subunit
MADFRTPLRRVRGLGAAREGTGHFWTMRVTSVALVPLTLFAVGLVVALAGTDHATVTSALSRPFVATVLMLTVLVGVHHMYLGMQEIILDYAHSDGAKFTLLMLNMFFCVAITAAIVIALLKLVFGG